MGGNEFKHLKQSLLAVLGTAVAVDSLSFNAVNNVVVVPGQLGVRRYKPVRIEGQPRKTQVVTVNEHVLCEAVRITAVVDETVEVWKKFVDTAEKERSGLEAGCTSRSVQK